MKYYLLLLLLQLLNLHGFSQKNYFIKPENADCRKPIEIKDTIFGPTSPPSGFGELMEISGSKSDLYAFEKEHNITWYFFKVKSNCTLEFEIIPEKITDDYDFLLFKYNGKSFCQDVANKKLLPVRSCISRNDKKAGSRTGLLAGATEEFIHSGPGESFCKALKVKKGEIYYLCLDNVYPNGGGHTIILHYKDCDLPVVVKQQDKVAENPASKTKTINIKVIDKETGKPVISNLSLTDASAGADKPPYKKFDSVNTAPVQFSGDFSYIIRSEAAGYFDNVLKGKYFIASGITHITVEMSRIKVGQNVVFENILFHGNSAKVLPESLPVLDGLVATMMRNPGLYIEIQGHVNCPTHWGDCDKKNEFNMQLSVSRAKAVYDYLSEKGTATQRMSYKGFGSSMMLYPDARSEDKMMKNRRVEIVVLKY